MDVISRKGALQGDISIPGSKSHTIRVVMMATIAEGTSIIHNPLPSKDGLAALQAASALGAVVTKDDLQDRWIITGTGGVPKAPGCIIDTMNSGTTVGFVLGIASLIRGWTVITGDEQICRRSWRPEQDGLIQLGAKCINTRPGSTCPPIIIGGPMKGGICHVEGRIAPHVSGIVFALPLLETRSETLVMVDNALELPYQQMTIDWMRRFGISVEHSPDFSFYRVPGSQVYKAQEVVVPADWSGAAFPLVAAACNPDPDTEVVVTGVDFNDSQGDKEVVDILIRMGANIEKDVSGMRAIVRGGAELTGTEVDMGDIPDTLPALSVAATMARGDMTFTNLGNLRVKETDRVAVMHELLTLCGGDVEVTPSAMIIHGGRDMHGATVPSYDDHRVAMAMAVAGKLYDGEMVVQNAECAVVSFPGFYEKMNKLGAEFSLC